MIASLNIASYYYLICLEISLIIIESCGFRFYSALGFFLDLFPYSPISMNPKYVVVVIYSKRWQFCFLYFVPCGPL